jgi:hypothetical protein
MLDDRTGSTMPVPPYIGHSGVFTELHLVLAAITGSTFLCRRPLSVAFIEGWNAALSRAFAARAAARFSPTKQLSGADSALAKTA